MWELIFILTFPAHLELPDFMAPYPLFETKRECKEHEMSEKGRLWTDGIAIPSLDRVVRVESLGSNGCAFIEQEKDNA